MTQEFINEMEAEIKRQKLEMLNRLLKEDSEFRELIGSKQINDSIDSVTEDLAFKKMQRNADYDTNKVQALDNALSRIHNHCYGKCLKCGDEIPEQRLRAIPYAVLCVPCKSGEERPVYRKKTTKVND
jgi:RNA polymerase-binding transcription factor DksA